MYMRAGRPGATLGFRRHQPMRAQPRGIEINKLVVTDASIAEIRGTRFISKARLSTLEVRELQEVQSVLQGGTIGRDDPVPRLQLVSGVDPFGEPHEIVSLWVPKDREAEASRIGTQGFVIS